MSLSRSRRPQGPSIKKHRCWTFLVGGVKRNGIVSGNEARVFAAFRAKYTAAKRLAISATRDKRRAGGAKGNGKAGKALSVEVQFTGPQPSEGPGLLLRDLLSGSSVEARPVNLGRGRKKKYLRVPAAAKAIVSVDEPNKNGGIDATRGETSSLDTVSDNECNKGDVDVTKPNEIDVITHGGLALPAWHRSGIEALATRESKCDRPVMMALSQPSVGLAEAMDQTSSALTPGPESLRPLDDVWSCFEIPQASPRDCANQTMTVDGGSAFDLLTITGDEKDDCGLAWRRGLTSSGSGDYDPLSDASELLRTAGLLDSSCVSEDSSIYGDSWTHKSFTVDENAANLMDSGQVARMDDSGVDSQDDSDLNGDERYPEVELLHKVCDFEGRPSLDGGSCRMATEPPRGGQSHLLLKGIKAVGQGDCGMPSISAFFSAGPSHKTDRIISHVKVGHDGVIQAAVFYPSMQVLWPDVYAAKNVQEVEVDVAVDLRWGDEEINCAGPSLKVTYRRPPVQATEATAASMIVCRRISPTPNDVPAEGGTMRDDYCGDFFM